MKKSALLFLVILNTFFLASCAQDKKKNTYKVEGKTVETSRASFDISLGSTFYMTGNDLNDLYISVTVNKGTVKENTEVDLVKKSNPSEKVSAIIYRIDDNYNQPIKVAKTGQEVTINLKVKNDKNFRLSNNGNEYSIVSKGQSVATAAVSKLNLGKATITIDGKPWKYEGYKIYHYTKDNGVHKNPANILITFYKTNKNVKMTGGEERLQVSIFHAPKNAKSYTNADMDVAFWTNMYGQETAYAKTLNNTSLNASAKITKYQTDLNKATLSGSILSVAKGSMCNGCPNIKIAIDFENLEAELYNN